MQHAAVVPHDNVARPPRMAVGARRLAAEKHELLYQLLGFRLIEFGDALDMTAYEQCGSFGHWMDFYQRVQRRLTIEKTVPGPDFDLVTDLRLGMKVAVVGVQFIQARSSLFVEGVVGGPDVGPLGFAARFRHDVRGQD